MKSDLNKNINGLIKYLELNSIEDLRALPIDNDLIGKVGNYLLESKEKITTSKVADLLGINRASIYNTYPKSAQYLQALIAQQKAINNQKKSVKKTSSVKNKTEKAPKFIELNEEKVHKFMSIIMSLEYQLARKNKQIQQMQAKIASLQSTINELEKRSTL